MLEMELTRLDRINQNDLDWPLPKTTHNAHCKDPLRATLRTRRISVSERPQSHDSLIFFCVFLFSFSYLLFSSPSCVRQQNNLQACNTRQPTHPNHSPFRPPFPFSFLLHLSSHSLGQHLPVLRHHHVATVHSLLISL